jgi:hypothetical protein
MTGKYMESIRATYGGCKKDRRCPEWGNPETPRFHLVPPLGAKIPTRDPGSCQELLPARYQVL